MQFRPGEVFPSHPAMPAAIRPALSFTDLSPDTLLVYSTVSSKIAIHTNLVLKSKRKKKKKRKGNGRPPEKRESAGSRDPWNSPMTLSDSTVTGSEVPYAL